MQIYKRYALLVIFFATVSISNGKTCAIQNTDTIYGKPGPYQIIADTFKNSQSQEHLFYIFRPSGIKTLPPCILFCPKFGSGNPIEYDGFIKYLVSKGFVVFFPRYKSQIFTRRFIKIGIRTDEMFSLIAKNATAYIDTTRIGFIGHDYGAGILPAVVKQITQSSGWGNNGVFMYLMSPWYFAGISKRELQAYPPQIRVVIQVFQDDDINDPRIGSNLFQLLNLKPEQKAFYIVYSDVLNHCRLKSNFHLPLSKEADEGEDNIMDTLALYRTADALTRSVFYNDSAATDFVFGNGKNRSLTMGTWENNTPVKEMLATDNPQSFIPLQTYVNSWTSLRNPFTEVSISRERIKNIGNYIRKKISNALNFLEHKSKKEENSNPNDIDIFPNPILSGYGAEGPFAMHVDSFGNPSYHKDPVFLFSPENKNGPAPVIILLHGYTGQDYLYFEPLISHIVSRGFAVIYPTYPLFPLASSENKVYIIPAYL